MPIRINVDSRESRRLLKAIDGLPRKMNRTVAEALRISAKEIAQDTRQRLRSGGGRRRRGRRAASQPGDPPARQSGTLAKSIGFRATRRDKLAYTVEARAFYARFLETGTSRGLAPRPFITAALDDNRTAAERRIIRAIVAVIESVQR